jgi:hypothetical protein
MSHMNGRIDSDVNPRHPPLPPLYLGAYLDLTPGLASAEGGVV